MSVHGSKLDGRVTLVSGAAQGIGAGIAQRFVGEGARVAIGDVDRRQGSTLAAELGDAAMFVELDVARPEAWERAITAVEDRFGPLNVLVNNAGIGASTYVESYAPADYERTLAVNLEGALLGMRAALPSLRRGGRGSIINVSSLQGVEADVGLMAYVASKFAIRGVTKSAALEFGKDGIRVNSIHPGVVRSSAYMRQIPDDFMGRIPLGRRDTTDRGATPADIAGLAVFLASDASSYVTGAEIVIDGGKSIRVPSVAADFGSLVEKMKGSL
ncbi:SDR family NAD(P)-dependent oxidoreductase [Nonomuraea sp. NPDC050153]|uniref:SDR family NAD(P)-dependent oxidoreductase n=1 Tax=Nonomuraea sp. NPDC050153 TaxID=3364359 RepID=UPI0037A60BF2